MRPISGRAPAKMPPLDAALANYAEPSGKRLPLGHLLYAIERENKHRLDRARYFKLLHGYTREVKYKTRSEGDPQRQLALLSAVVFQLKGMRYKQIRVTRADQLFISDLLTSRIGGQMQFVLLFLVLGRAANMKLYPVMAGDEMVVRLAGPQGLTVVPAQQGDVRPVQYHIRRHNLKGTELPLVSEADLLARLFWSRGQLLARMGRKSEAVRDLERVLVLQKDHKPAMIELASIYEDLKQLEKARKMFTRLVGAGGATPQMYWRRAELYIGRRQWARAARDLRAYLAQQPDARGYHLLGTALEGKPDMPAAIKAYEQAIALGDTRIAALSHGRIRAIRGPLLLAQFVGSKSYAGQVNALRALGRLGDSSMAPKLIGTLKHDNLRLRWQVAQTLRQMLDLPEKTYLRLGIDHAAWSLWWREKQRSKKKPAAGN